MSVQSARGSEAKAKQMGAATNDSQLLHKSICRTNAAACCTDLLPHGTDLVTVHARSCDQHAGTSAA
jgi:hypothetical protein